MSDARRLAAVIDGLKESRARVKAKLDSLTFEPNLTLTYPLLLEAKRFREQVRALQDELTDHDLAQLFAERALKHTPAPGKTFPQAGEVAARQGRELEKKLAEMLNEH